MRGGGTQGGHGGAPRGGEEEGSSLGSNSSDPGATTRIQDEQAALEVSAGRDGLVQTREELGHSNPSGPGSASVTAKGWRVTIGGSAAVWSRSDPWTCGPALSTDGPGKELHLQTPTFGFHVTFMCQEMFFSPFPAIKKCKNHA